MPAHAPPSDPSRPGIQIHHYGPEAGLTAAPAALNTPPGRPGRAYHPRTSARSAAFADVVRAKIALSAAERLENTVIAARRDRERHCPDARWRRGGVVQGLRRQPGRRRSSLRRISRVSGPPRAEILNPGMVRQARRGAAAVDECEQVGVERVMVAGVQAMPGARVDGEAGAADEFGGLAAGEFDGR